MTNFVPGKVVKSFRSRKGKEILIRYPRWEDLDAMTEYINLLSAEDTFLTFSGECLGREEEAGFLAGLFQDMEFLRKVYLCALEGNTLAATCMIYKRPEARDRGRHVAAMGIAVDARFRGEGIGYALLSATIDEARSKLPDLKIVLLDVYGENTAAMNLYRKAGFQETGRVPGGVLHRGRLIDEIQMILTLAQSRPA